MTAQNLIWIVIRLRFQELVFADCGRFGSHMQPSPAFSVRPAPHESIGCHGFRAFSQDMKATFLDMSTIPTLASYLDMSKNVFSATLDYMQ
jgi:hypothetical protein